MDKRNFVDRKVQDCPPWTLYGARGKDPAVHALSAYELAQHYYLKQAWHPLTQKLQARHKDPEQFHAVLTEEGLQKLGRGVKSLQPLVDYKIKEEGGASWRPLGRGQHAAGYRHDWVLERKRCPFVPVVQGAQGARTQEEQAMRILVLFFPWVNDPSEATPQVPFIADFWRADCADWCQALRCHANSCGFPTQEVKTLALNFVFAYCLPREVSAADVEHSDDEGLVDELDDLHLDEDELLEATATHVRGSGAREGEETPEAEAGAGKDAESQSTKLHNMTMQMIGLSGSIWLGGDKPASEEARERHRQMQGAAGSIRDPEAAIKAGKAGPKKQERRKGASGLIGGVLPGEVEARRRVDRKAFSV